MKHTPRFNAWFGLTVAMLGHYLLSYYGPWQLGSFTFTLNALTLREYIVAFYFATFVLLLSWVLETHP